MAAALLSSLLGTLSSLALKELGIAWGLQTELENLKSTMTTIQAVIQDAESKQWTRLEVKDWLRKLKDSAYDADNMVDEFATEALKSKLDSQRGARHQVSAFFSLRNRLIFRLKMGHRIEDVTKKLDAIAGERVKFHLREGVVETENLAVDRRQTSSLVNESEIYGRNDEKEGIVKMLLDNLSDHDNVSVYAIWGMGGLGKTTLAKLVYNDSRVEGNFDLRIWVYVSVDFDVGRLTRAILESIEGGECNISNLDPLQRRLQDKLSERRFLLVLDDVWNGDKWDELKDVLRCGAKGSKVIVTTRIHTVAQIMATIPVHRMGYLSEDDSWSLFKQRAFGIRRGEENHGLNKIGKEIVKRCRGLPLAIKALGSLMQFKSSKREWLAVKDSEIWDLPDDGRGILPALRLSYDNLPPHMRQCFAFCCIFPKDYPMEKDLLIALWMANGFIPFKGETTLHDMGHEIFNDLVWRSFLQDVEKDDYRGETTCKMHDLMHDLAQSIMIYECAIVGGHKRLRIPEKFRHLSLQAGRFPSNEVVLEVPSLRSFVVLPGYNSCWEKILRCISKQKYLRVLDLSDQINVEKLPISISNFNHLRYLDMSECYIKTLPESICDFQNLQTLILKNCYRLCKLPKRMKHMTNLIYLDIRGCRSLASMPAKLGQLTCLRRLSTFIVGQDKGYQIGELKELNLGGELSIKELDNVRSSADAKSANLKRKQDLISLNLHWSESNKDILPNNAEEVLEGLHPNPNLKKLRINHYQGSKFPNWMLGSVLKNLVRISLSYCTRCEQLPPLGKLLSLKELNIVGMDSLKFFNHEYYRDGEISFQALKTLNIWRMPSLEEWTTTDRQEIFPCLQQLDILECPKLNNLPFLPTLERLSIDGDNKLIFRSVSNLTSLSSLMISESELMILPDGLFQNHKALESLQLSSIYNLEALPDQLDSLSSLKHLHIEDCPKLENFSGLENLNSLETLNITDCDSLTALPVQGLKGLTSLRSLDLHNNRRLMSLSDGIQYLRVLQRLLINGSPELESLPEGMQHLDVLQNLWIWDCDGLLSLPNWLGSLQSLSNLGIRFCPNLRSMLEGLQTLKTLSICQCPHLESRCNKENGEDWLKIAHIPVIYINGVQDVLAYSEVEFLTPGTVL